MKKKLCVLCALPLLFGAVSAQNFPIPDGHFENWKTEKAEDGSTYDELGNPFWTSLNQLASLPASMFTGPVTMYKETGRSGKEGDYAPKLVANEMLYGDSGMIFLPGVIGTLDVVFDKLTARTGRAFTSRPKAIKGYMKYFPVNGDSASIYVGLTRYNEAAGRRQPVGLVDKIYKDTISEWTEFNLPIDYFSEETPDTVMVFFVSSAGYDRNFERLMHCKGELGSTLWVDDVEFVYEGEEPGPSTNNENTVLAASKLYPNPSFNGIFNLNVQEACRAEVISVAGRLVMQQNFNTAGAYTFDLSRFAPGVYYIRLSNQEGAAILKAVRR
ncbi:MAG: PCMD domain-containing protein [Bacteroidales bacterium]|nr:PCMD domain-containing protein [Bacteroidales bacterium]